MGTEQTCIYCGKNTKNRNKYCQNLCSIRYNQERRTEKLHKNLEHDFSGTVKYLLKKYGDATPRRGTKYYDSAAISVLLDDTKNLVLDFSSADFKLLGLRTFDVYEVTIIHTKQNQKQARNHTIMYKKRYSYDGDKKIFRIEWLEKGDRLKAKVTVVKRYG